MMTLSVQNHGTILIVQPETEAALRWLEDNVQSDALWWCGGLVVEPRYIEAIVRGARADGLRVSR